METNQNYQRETGADLILESDLAPPKFSTTGPTIWTHGKHPDWCHLCGQRSSDTADIWYSNNAENDPKSQQKYIRICAECASKIEKVAKAQRAYVMPDAVDAPG